MKRFSLSDDFTDIAAERGLIAAICADPSLIQKLGEIPAGLFWDEAEAWAELSREISDGEQPALVQGWEPVTDPQSTLDRLRDLYPRRMLANALEEVSAQLYKPEQSIRTILGYLTQSLAQAESAVSDVPATQLLWAKDVISKVFAEVEERARAWQQTGILQMGLSTGICGLDKILDGLKPGIYLLAGGPGLGKTTLVLQVARNVCRDALVLFVTFENSPENLVLKAIASGAKVNTRDLESGATNVHDLSIAAVDLIRDVAGSLAFIQGTSLLSVDRLGSCVYGMREQSERSQCIVIIDYLQLWAKCGTSFRKFDTTRGRVEALCAELRELAMHLQCPVLCIASQNRDQGGYGEGIGKANLDSLKESGDLEYLADVVMFLVGSNAHLTTPPERALDLNVRKNRHGDVGLVRLAFNPEICRFREEDQHA